MRTPATEQHLNQILDNIDRDLRLTDAEKHETRECANVQRASLIADATLTPAIWSGHCGTKISVLDNQPEMFAASAGSRLGNIWAMRSFQSSVASQLRCNVMEAQRIVEIACKPAIDRDEDEEEELAELFARLRLRGDGECWLFSGPVLVDDPFDGLEFGTLSCRLGLPYRVGEDFVTFSVPPPDDTRRPCVLDADWFFQQFWRPGGRTRAFCATCADGGLEEWIGTPPRLDETGGPISVQSVGDGNPVGSLPYDVT